MTAPATPTRARTAPRRGRGWATADDPAARPDARQPRPLPSMPHPTSGPTVAKAEARLWAAFDEALAELHPDPRGLSPWPFANGYFWLRRTLRTGQKLRAEHVASARATAYTALTTARFALERLDELAARFAVGEPVQVEDPKGRRATAFVTVAPCDYDLWLVDEVARLLDDRARRLRVALAERRSLRADLLALADRTNAERL